MLLNIPVAEVEYFDDIESIDDVAKRLGWEDEGQMGVDDMDYYISPEQEFIVHCSNIQVWVENCYDTRLLHYSLSLNLLRELSEYDPCAKSILKEEIAKRLESGCESVINYIHEEFLHEYLTHDEYFQTLLVPEEAELLLKLESFIKTRIPHSFFYPVSYLDAPDTSIVEDRHGISLCLNYSNLDTIPDIVCNFKYLKHLKLRFNKW